LLGDSEIEPTAVAPGLAVMLALCAGGARFHEGRTALSAFEKLLLLRAPERQRDGVRRFWKRPGARVRTLKWSEETSSIVEGAPAQMLAALAQELRRFKPGRAGLDVAVTATVYRFCKRWWGATEISCEIVGREPCGRMVWVADDTVQVADHLREGVVDGEVLAREVMRRLGAELLGR
jgi:hypothetical protein